MSNSDEMEGTKEGGTENRAEQSAGKSDEAQSHASENDGSPNDAAAHRAESESQGKKKGPVFYVVIAIALALMFTGTAGQIVGIAIICAALGAPLFALLGIVTFACFILDLGKTTPQELSSMVERMRGLIDQKELVANPPLHRERRNHESRPDQHSVGGFLPRLRGLDSRRPGYERSLRMCVLCSDQWFKSRHGDRDRRDDGALAYRSWILGALLSWASEFRGLARNPHSAIDPHDPFPDCVPGLEY